MGKTSLAMVGALSAGALTMCLSANASAASNEGVRPGVLLVLHGKSGTYVPEPGHSGVHLLTIHGLASSVQLSAPVDGKELRNVETSSDSIETMAPDGSVPAVVTLHGRRSGVALSLSQVKGSGGSLTALVGLGDNGSSLLASQRARSGDRLPSSFGAVTLAAAPGLPATRLPGAANSVAYDVQWNIHFRIPRAPSFIETVPKGEATGGSMKTNCADGVTRSWRADGPAPRTVFLNGKAFAALKCGADQTRQFWDLKYGRTAGVWDATLGARTVQIAPATYVSTCDANPMSSLRCAGGIGFEEAVIDGSAN